MKMFILALCVIASSQAYAKQLSCPVGVYRASDLLSETAFNKASGTVRVQIKDDVSEAKLVINGTTLEASAYKRDYADVYDVTFAIMTPPNERAPKELAFKALLTEFLINDGPAKEGPWTVDYAPGAVSYSFMKNPNGTLALSNKMVRALQDQKMWGTPQIASAILNVQEVPQVAAAVNILLKNKAIASTDIVGIATLMNCTMN